MFVSSKLEQQLANNFESALSEIKTLSGKGYDVACVA
jgi:hypothetical protein